MNDRLSLGILLPTWKVAPGRPGGWAELLAFAQSAETAGFDLIWVADHIGHGFPDGSYQDFWEAWSILAALAASTQRIGIGSLVTSASLRHPVLLARMISAVDEISDGRLTVGIGAGGPTDRAWDMLDIPADRLVSRLADALSILMPLLREGSVTYEGRAFRARNATLGPRREGRRPPLWVGCAAGPRMLHLAAQWADGVNLMYPGSIYVSTPDEVRELNAATDAACDSQGRSPSELVRTGSTMVSFAPEGYDQAEPRGRAIHGTDAEIARGLGEFHDAGMSHLWVAIDNPDQPGPAARVPLQRLDDIERMTGVIRELRGQGH